VVPSLHGCQADKAGAEQDAGCVREARRTLPREQHVDECAPEEERHREQVAQLREVRLSGMIGDPAQPIDRRFARGLNAEGGKL
jgi:hypothetical protein